jgi:hypothetical protein
VTAATATAFSRAALADLRVYMTTKHLDEFQQGASLEDWIFTTARAIVAEIPMEHETKTPEEQRTRYHMFEGLAMRMQQASKSAVPLFGVTGDRQELEDACAPFPPGYIGFVLALAVDNRYYGGDDEVRYFIASMCNTLYGRNVPGGRVTCIPGQPFLRLDMIRRITDHAASRALAELRRPFLCESTMAHWVCLAKWMLKQGAMFREGLALNPHRVWTSHRGIYDFITLSYNDRIRADVEAAIEWARLGDVVDSATSLGRDLTGLVLEHMGGGYVRQSGSERWEDSD